MDKDNSTDHTRSSPQRDSIGRLLRLAGPRPEVPPEARRRVYETVETEWRRAVRKRRILFRAGPVALAATLTLAVVALVDRQPVTVAPVVATVVFSAEEDRALHGFRPGDSIRRGDSIDTGSSGLTLETRDGLSLRLDAGTRVTLEAKDELILESGRLYADTGAVPHTEAAVTVHTPMGTVVDLGTRFAVTFSGTDMTVAVREGKVEIDDRQGRHLARAGDLLVVTHDRRVLFDEVRPDASSWDWVTKLAPPFEIESRSLYEFLRWVARETGKELVFDNDGLRYAVMGTTLHGSIESFSPSEALPAVLATTRFSYRLENSRIVIATGS